MADKPLENITSQNEFGQNSKSEKFDFPSTEQKVKMEKKEKFLGQRKSIEINEFPKSKEVLKLVEDAFEEEEETENKAEV